MPRIDIRGVLIPNDYKWYYDLFEEDSTCPRDVKNILDTLMDNDDLEVYINSPGGIIDVGSEIYTMLRRARDTANLRIYITGEACSAASVVAMAGHCEMSPTALMMVHCVSSRQSGNHSDMEHMAETLRTADEALCTAYMSKTGMSKEEALEMMEHETWLTAEQAKERGLIDAVMFDDKEEFSSLIAGPALFKLPTKDQMNRTKKMINIQNTEEDEEAKLKKQKISKKFEALKAIVKPERIRNELSGIRK